MIISKFGTAEVVRDGQVMVDRFRDLHDQSVRLASGGLSSLWVVSGANALGGGEAGQAKLMDALGEASDSRVEEILVRPDDLFTPEGRHRHQEKVQKIWDAGRTPAVNGHPDEDLNNDIVAGAEAVIMGRVRSLLLLTAVGGVKGPEGIIRHVHTDTVARCLDLVDDTVSPLGKGGMRLKVNVAWNTVSAGHAERATIATATDTDVLLHAAEGRFVGTTFTLGAVGSQRSVEINKLSF